jgi:hypothetical protein
MFYQEHGVGISCIVLIKGRNYRRLLFVHEEILKYARMTMDRVTITLSIVHI